MVQRLAHFAAAASLLANGASALLPSTYLNYEDPATGANKMSWFSTFDPQASAHSTFFAVQRSDFGYLGIQQESTWAGWLTHRTGLPLNGDITDEFDGLVIFSVWDGDGATCTTKEVGLGAYKDRFSGEGTGCQIKMKKRWGKEMYSFVTTATTSMNDGQIELAGWFYDPTGTEGVPEWVLVGKIVVAQQTRVFGKGFSTFIEQFRDLQSGDLRMANYGPQFLETTLGQWTPMSQARFSTTQSDTSVHTVASVIDNGSRFSMGLAGKDKMANTPQGTLLTLSNPGAPASSAPLQSFIALRAANKLPVGCTDLSWRFSVCGGSVLSPLWGFLAFFVPTSLAKFIFDVFMIAIIVTIVCCVLQCIAQVGIKRDPVVYVAGKDRGGSRSLVRTMMP